MCEPRYNREPGWDELTTKQKIYKLEMLKYDSEIRKLDKEIAELEKTRGWNSQADKELLVIVGGFLLGGWIL